MTNRGFGRLALGCALTTAVVLGLASPVAARPAGVSGGFVVNSDVQTVIAQAAGNVVIAEVLTLDYDTGGLQGSAIDSDTLIVHGDGSYEGQGIEVCDGCTVDGSSPGGFVAVFTFRGVGDNYSGRLTVISADGGLSALHGGGQFVGTISTNVNSYDYHFHFAMRPA